MAHKAIDVYLNDHLGGATVGANLAGQIADHAEETSLAALMTGLQAEIQADRETLTELMERMEGARNPVKQATGWLAEVRERSGLPARDRPLQLGLAHRGAALDAELKVVDDILPLLSGDDDPRRASRDHGH